MAFTHYAPEKNTTGIVVASPHSGRHYPASLLQAARVDAFDLRKSEDAWVDELVSDAPLIGAELILATYARVYVDLNRDAHEVDTSMYSGSMAGGNAKRSQRVVAGLGVIPRIASDGRDIYRTRLPWTDAQHRIEHVYRPYHSELKQLLAKTIALHGAYLLIDAHSMPSIGCGDPAPDIVLGDRYGSSCASLVTMMAESFLKARGYRVVRNAPYAGGWSTQHYGKPFDGRHALQIEVNRALYMDEATLMRSEVGMARVRADLAGFFQELAQAIPRLSQRAPMAAE